MTKWIGVAAVAAALALSGLASIDAAQAASATELSAGKHVRHYARSTRPYYPTYYGRPTVYAPAPFVPIPPFFGYGWEWW